MLAKRIIPCLDIKEGRTVKGTNFAGLRDAGDAVELASRYSQEGADELVFLDISATNEKRRTFAPLVKRVAETIDIPFTVGGGINSVGDIEVLLSSGADKVSINTAAVLDPELISRAALAFGSQCIVVAIDAKLTQRGYRVVLNGGRKDTDIDAMEWATECASRGAGEILLTSIDADGTKAGFDLGFTSAVSDSVRIPVIASGGAGTREDFEDVLSVARADAALAASVFHFGEIAIPDLKEFLRFKNIEVRL
jgi:cyclase